MYQSYCAFIILYLLSWFLFHKESVDITGRHVSNIHCISICLFLISNFLLNNKLEYGLLENSITYWAMDMIVSFFRGTTLDKPMLIHHSLAIVGCLVSRQHLLPLTLSSEVSTIFLNKTWMMNERKETRTKKFVNYCRCLVLSFFIFRVVNFSWMLYYFFDTNFIDSYFFIPIWLLNLYWFYMIVRMGVKYNIYF